MMYPVSASAPTVATSRALTSSTSSQRKSDKGRCSDITVPYKLFASRYMMWVVGRLES